MTTIAAIARIIIVQTLTRRSKRLGRREVAPRLLVEAALRREAETGVVVRVLGGQEQIRRDHSIVGDLPEPVEREARVGVVLMERR